MSLLHETRHAGCVRLGFMTPLLSVEVLRELECRLHDTARTAHCRALVLSSEHPSIFLAGAHLREIAGLDGESSAAYARLGRRVLDRIVAFPRPTVAAIDGSVSGGGFDLVLCCDAVVAAPRATFSHPGVTRGLVTGWGGTTRLPLAVGRSTTRRAMIGGETLSAGELRMAGFVRHVDPDPVRRAFALASRLQALHSTRLQAWRLLRDGRDVRTSWPAAARAIIY
jgi:enoyl-CoA hydratase/carnithine racemase